LQKLWFWLQRVDASAEEVDKVRLEEMSRKKAALTTPDAATQQQPEEHPSPAQAAGDGGKQVRSRRSRSGLWYRLRMAVMGRSLELPQEPAPAQALQILRQRQQGPGTAPTARRIEPSAAAGGVEDEGGGDQGGSSGQPWDVRWGLLMPARYYGPVGQELTSKALREADKIVKMAGVRKHMGLVSNWEYHGQEYGWQGIQ
jgi:hypothetical protein